MSQNKNTGDLNLSVDLFGYIVCPTNMNPIEREKTATLRISQKGGETIIDLKLISNEVTFSYFSISVKTELYVDSKGNYIIRYEIDEPSYGFFMEMNSFTSITLFNLAFDNEKYQFNYDGIINQGNEDFQLASIIEPLVFKVESEIPHECEISLDELKQEILLLQENSLFIDNDRYIEMTGMSSLLGTIRFTNYGLVHENWIKYDSWVG